MTNEIFNLNDEMLLSVAGGKNVECFKSPPDSFGAYETIKHGKGATFFSNDTGKYIQNKGNDCLIWEPKETDGAVFL